MKIIILVLSLGLGCLLHAQVSKTVNVPTAGTLTNLLTADEKTTVTNLKVTGNINKLDFDVMKAMLALQTVDLGSARINAWQIYPANQIPSNSFDPYNGSPGGAIISSITLPSTTTSLANNAFENLDLLTSLTIPASVTSIGIGAFNGSRIKTFHVSTLIPIPLPNVTDLYSVDYIFYGIYSNSNERTLYVPVGSKAAYQAANQWKDFTNIVEEGPLSANTEANSQSIQLYPNPVENELSVAGIEGNASIQIVTLEGKSLLNQTIKSNEKVNVAQLPAGLYIARITTAEGTIEKKIVKQ